VGVAGAAPRLRPPAVPLAPLQLQPRTHRGLSPRFFFQPSKPCPRPHAPTKVEGRNKELENEVLSLRKAAEQAVAEMRTLQGDLRRKEQDVGSEWPLGFLGGGLGRARCWTGVGPALLGTARPDPFPSSLSLLRSLPPVLSSALEERRKELDKTQEELSLAQAQIKVGDRAAPAPL
jgi:hypothetical protein